MKNLIKILYSSSKNTLTILLPLLIEACCIFSVARISDDPDFYVHPIGSECSPEKKRKEPKSETKRKRIACRGWALHIRSSKGASPRAGRTRYYLVAKWSSPLPRVQIFLVLLYVIGSNVELTNCQQKSTFAQNDKVDDIFSEICAGDGLVSATQTFPISITLAIVMLRAARTDGQGDWFHSSYAGEFWVRFPLIRFCQRVSKVEWTAASERWKYQI
jgi:hypothetical protein